MSHIVIVGGSAALAQPLYDLWLPRHKITAVCRYEWRYKTDTIKKCKTRAVSGLKVVTNKNDVRTPIHGLVTLTGSTENKRLPAMDKPSWDGVVEDCLTAPFQALRYFLPLMAENSNVVIVGSIVGSLGGIGCANYAAAKAGLGGLVRAAANEFATRHIHVNLLELGYTNVGMGERLPENLAEKIRATIPLKRFGNGDDFALAVDFLMNTKYMTGNTLTLAGGLR